MKFGKVRKEEEKMELLVLALLCVSLVDMLGRRERLLDVDIMFPPSLALFHPFVQLKK